LGIRAQRNGVDPTNNQAERDLRGEKTSYGSKSERGGSIGRESPKCGSDAEKTKGKML